MIKRFFANKRSIVASAGIVLVAIVAIAATLFLKKTAVSEAVTVTSDDGKATLEIPEGALPKNIDPNAISIKNIGVEEVDIGLHEGDYNAEAYRLEPGGTVFSKPLSFRLTREAAIDSLPAVLHVSGDNRELDILNGVILDTDLGQGTATLTAPIVHFSDLVIFNFVIGSVTLDVVPATPVGETVYASASVKLREFYSHGQSYIDDVDGTMRSSGVLTPAGPVKDRPSRSLLPFEVRSDDFTCSKEGEGTIYWDFVLRSHVGYVRAETADGQLFDSIDEAGRHGKIVSTWHKERDVVTMANYSIPARCGKGMVRLCPMATEICEGSGVSFTGYYECDPLTGEAINDILLDLETGEPINGVCP